MIRLNPGVTLAYFKKDRNGLISADDHYDLAFVRNYLAFNGIHTTQYIETNLTLFHDLLDDLVRLKNNVFIFYLDGKNDEITQMVTHKLKQINAEFILILVGIASMDKEEDKSAEGIPDKVITENIAEKLLASLMGVNNQSKRIFTGGEISSLYQASPYTSGAIPPKLANRYGIRLNVLDLTESLRSDSSIIAAQLIEEFRLFESYGVTGTIPFLDDNMLKHLDLFQNLMDRMKHERYSFTLSGKLSLEEVSKEILDKLIHNRFKLLEIIISELNEEAISKIVEIENLILSHELKIVYSPNLRDGRVKEKNLNDLFYSVKNIDQFLKRVNLTSLIDAWGKFNQYQKYPFLLRDYIDHYKTAVHPESALVNGYVSCLTGFYPYNFKGGNSKHIVVQSQVLQPEVYQNLGSFLGINSALIHHSKQRKKVQQENLLYSKNDDFIRARDEVFEFNKTHAKQEGTFLPHYHQVYQSEEKYIEQLQIDDHHVSAQVKTLKAPYRHVRALKLLDDNNFLSITQKEDLDLFLSNVNSFIMNGRFRHNYEISTILMDGCRWGGQEHCTLTKLHRFYLDDRQNIFPCGGSSKVIGSCSDSYIDIVRKAFHLSEEEEEIRGCSTCPVKNTCSKCAMLPDFLDREQYCEVRRRQSYISEYINISNMVRTLMKNFTLFKNSTLNSIKVTTSCKSHLFSNDMDCRGDIPIHDYLYLVFLREDAYIIDSRNFKLLQVNGPVALIFEGLLKGAITEQIKEELMKKLQVSMQNVDILFRKVIDKLLELNYLDYKKISDFLKRVSEEQEGVY